MGFVSLSIGLRSLSSRICFLISQIAWPVRVCVCVLVVMAVPSGKQGIRADPKERRNEAGAFAGCRLCVWASYRVSHQGRWHSGHSGYVPASKSECSVEFSRNSLKKKSCVIFASQHQICWIRLRTWQPSTPTPSLWCWTSPAKKATLSIWSKTTTSSSGIIINSIHFIMLWH